MEYFVIKKILKKKICQVFERERYLYIYIYIILTRFEPQTSKMNIISQIPFCKRKNLQNLQDFFKR
jgi:hypothetical protein